MLIGLIATTMAFTSCKKTEVVTNEQDSIAVDSIVVDSIDVAVDETE